MAQDNGVEAVALYSMSGSGLLAICWLAGLVCGMLLSLYAGTPIFSMMRSALYAPVSIVSLLITGLIPFLFTAFAVFISKPWLIFAICFCKACLVSFVSTGISAAYGSAGWLVCSLLLFHSGAVCVMLHLLWSGILSGRRGRWLAALLGMVAAGFASYYIISPFVACLIEH